MAKGKKTGGNDFKTGNSANPTGRPKLPGDIKAARFLNQIELERILNELIYETNAGDLDSVILDPQRKPIEHIIARIILEAIERGDALRFDFLLNRILGKVTDKVRVELPTPVIIERRDGSTVELASKLGTKEES